jgi:sec-independent protein translocase protein TatA
MPGQVGMPELLLVLVIALLVLGPQRLPKVARNLGRGIREFKEAITMDNGDDDDAERQRQRDLERKTERAPEADPAPKV